MLRFFRQLRQRLLAENKFSRYLLYASGEIILVVIGILIALQVNNWNTTRLEQNKSRAYLEKLSEELFLMDQAFNKQKPFIERDIKIAHDALRYLEGCGKPASLEEAFRETMISHQTIFKYSAFRNTYDEMIASGAFSGLENSELKTLVFQAYNTLELAQEQIDYFRDEVGRASAVIYRHVTFSYDQQANLTAAFEINSLCGNTEFQNAVVEIIDAREDWLRGLSFIQREVQQALKATQNQAATSLNN